MPAKTTKDPRKKKATPRNAMSNRCKCPIFSNNQAPSGPHRDYEEKKRKERPRGKIVMNSWPGLLDLSAPPIEPLQLDTQPRSTASSRPFLSTHRTPQQCRRILILRRRQGAHARLADGIAERRHRDGRVDGWGDGCARVIVSGEDRTGGTRRISCGGAGAGGAVGLVAEDGAGGLGGAAARVDVARGGAGPVPVVVAVVAASEEAERVDFGEP